jgi:hypothetical protein
LGFLGPSLASEVGDRATIVLRVRESGLIQAELTTWRDALPKVLRALKKIHKRFANEVDHKSGCFGDTLDTSQEGCLKCLVDIGSSDVPPNTPREAYCI